MCGGGGVGLVRRGGRTATTAACAACRGSHGRLRCAEAGAGAFGDAHEARLAGDGSHWRARAGPLWDAEDASLRALDVGGAGPLGDAQHARLGTPEVSGGRLSALDIGGAGPFWDAHDARLGIIAGHRQGLLGRAPGRGQQIRRVGVNETLDKGRS